MYSLCSGGMNNSACHTKSHQESDICRLVCFSSALLLLGPLSHAAICYIICALLLDKKKRRTNDTKLVIDMKLLFLFFLSLSL